MTGVGVLLGVAAASPLHDGCDRVEKTWLGSSDLSLSRRGLWLRTEPATRIITLTR